MMESIRVEYDSLLDDMLAAHLAQSGNLRTLRNTRINNAAIIGFVFGVMMAYVARHSFAFSLSTALIAGFSFGAAMGMWVWFESKYRFRRHLTNMLAELRGTRGRVRTLIEMNAKSVTMEWRGVTLTCTWPAVTVVDDAPRHVEISAPGGMTMVIPARAFADDQAKSKFAAQARSWREAAGGQWARVGRRNCVVCEYDLYGCDGAVCPECGTSIDAPVGLKV